jgi:tRNA pseudouridine55 synthase
MPELGYFLNIDKPAGITSRDVVNRVVKYVGTKRVGHAGTLDPMATGVLIVAINRATRLVEYVQQQQKTYDATFLLGQSSDTDDIEGNVAQHSTLSEPSPAEVQQALSSFQGDIDQVPPQFSALKVQGRAAYNLARQGINVDLAPRRVRIDSIVVQSYQYPELRLTITCGSGTYIRSIARDLGQLLGTGGLMSQLRRSAIGAFHVDQAASLDHLDQAVRHSLGTAVVGYRGHMVDDEGEIRFHQGKIFTPLRGDNDSPASGSAIDAEIAVFNRMGHFLGMAKLISLEPVTYQPIKGGFTEPSRFSRDE